MTTKTEKLAGREVEELKYPGMESPDTAFDPSPTSPPSQASSNPQRPQQTAQGAGMASEAHRADTTRDVPALPDSVKAAPILTKFREMFGLKKLKPKYKTVSAFNSETGLEEKMTFGFRPLGTEEFSWAIVKSSKYPVVDEFHAMHNRAWKIPILAAGLATIDEGELGDRPGTPTWQQLGLTPEPADVLDPYNPSVTIRLQCAEVFEELIRSSFYAFVEDLFDYYEAEIEKSYRAVKEANTNVGPLALADSGNSTTNSGSGQS